MKRVLVTGASGFIGRQTLAPLLQADYEVYALSSKNIPLISSPIHHVQCNLLHLDEVSKVLEEIKPTHLLHFAWYTKHGKLWESIENIDWVKASLHLIQEFARFGGERVVVAGSCAEYAWSHEFFSEEMTPCTPDSLYGKAKNCLRILLEEYGKKLPLSIAWGRVFFLYGPYEDEKKLVASMITSLLKDQSFTLQNGNLVRDFLHVSDVASAFVDILGSEVQGIINIGSGEGVSLRKLGEIVQTSLNKTSQLQTTNLEPSFQTSHTIVADVAKLKNVLGWSPKYSLEKGLLDAALWWRENASAPIS